MAIQEEGNSGVVERGGMILGMNVITLIILVFLIGVGVFDLYLYFQSKRTISQKIHAWFPKWGDALVLIGIMAGIWAVLGPNFFVTVLCGVLVGHFFWNEE